MTIMTRLVALVAVMTLCLWADARAEQFVIRMPCDTVTIQGVTYPRVRFKIQNPSRFAICVIQASPIAQPGLGDTCRAVSAVAPPNWGAWVDPNGSVLWFTGATIGEAMAPGQAVDGFEIILTNEHSCCYHFTFGCLFESDSAENVSFACDGSTCSGMPVPVRRRSWGHLKSLYR
jgi:hypothetical protein